MSGEIISSPAKHEGCIGTAKSERIAQYPIQRPAKSATWFHHIERRQGRIGYAIPEMRRESAVTVIILHRQPAQSGFDRPSRAQRMSGQWFSRTHGNPIAEELVDHPRFHSVVLQGSSPMKVDIVDRLGRNSSA